MSQPNAKETVALSREDLIAIIEAARQPMKSEKEIRDEKQALADREQMGKLLEQGRVNKLAEQKACQHMRRDGSTTTVFCGLPLNKLYCQKCAAWIGPDQAELFDKHFQLQMAE